MFEQLLTVLKPRTAEDNSDLPFPSGTPYKGIVRSVNSITGDALAAQIGLVGGVSINNDAGWLHFVEPDGGLEVLVAKKPLRTSLSWNAIKAATVEGTKTIQLFGEEWVVTVMTGYKTDPSATDNANTGGQWNRYIGGVYTGPMRSNPNWPVDIPSWGPYTADMLGVMPGVGDGTATNIVPGSIDYTLEAIPNSTNQSMRGFTYASGFPRMLGAHYGISNEADFSSGWRPMLVKKSTIPPPPPIPYKGLVPSSELITGTALAAAVGLTYTAQQVYVDNVEWVHIEEDGKTYYFAKQCPLVAHSRDQLVAADVLSGNKTVVIAGKTYKVRALTGVNDSTSEWNRWMYYLYDGAVTTNAALPPRNKRWALFNDVELDVCPGNGATPIGGLTYIKDYVGNPVDTRGYTSIVTGLQSGGNQLIAAYGWRPVLELVP